MALFLEPGEVMVGDGREIEARLFGPLGVADEVGRAVLLRHQLVAELHHVCASGLGDGTCFRTRGAARRLLSQPVAHADVRTASARSSAMIRKLSSGEYRLYSRKIDPRTGRRRNLGTFKSRAAAEKHE